MRQGDEQTSSATDRPTTAQDVPPARRPSPTTAPLQQSASDGLSADRRTGDLEALEAITEAALSTLDWQELLQRLIRRMVEATGARSGVILLLDGNTLVPRAAAGLDEQDLAAYRPINSSGFAGRVLAADGPLRLRDAAAESGHQLPYARKRSVRAMLGVPLKADGQTLGVAHIELSEDRDFTPREIHRFEVMADRAAGAIIRARLLEQARERSAELERANAELARANAELTASNAELREVDRLKTEFISMVSHELRTPLTAIIGYTDLLLRGTHGQLNERQARHQAAVKLGAQRLLGLINDLLDVARLDSGLLELDNAEVSLAQVFEQSLATARTSAAEAGIHLRVEIPPDLPTIWGDHSRLVQVVNNLLSNAIKFTPTEGRVELWAEALDTAGRVRICVRDTGAGISQDHLAHIWDRFYQADSGVRRRYGGTGLGLTIVRKLVELHGGNVVAASPGPGRGATFCFELPAYQRPTPQPVAPALPRTPAVGAPTVLVVEDQPDNRELLTTMLEEMLNLQVITAADGLAALERAREQPALILLDLMLPHLDGFEVVRRLKANPATRQIPVLALTALARPAERDEALAAGCDGLIVKPFDTDDLIEAVQHHLQVPT